ncbi:Planctomycete cytochrome C [Planctomycetes bacterium Pan216]|uniref:Planctomycete cytochrome C n=1 Tax=Kolteria novifilia TaxID=2527975 RepID=A0A518B427_9BACT|nr:Planctomycete cytochrome C [Planctomycetes bacterium Pan216]
MALPPSHRVLLAALCVLSLARLVAAAAPEGRIEFFERKIRPVLLQYCAECHSAKEGETNGGLSIDTRSGMRTGGDSGPAVVPKDKEASLILAAIRHETFEMPPDQKLPEKVIADFERWIEMGADDPRDGKAPPPKPKTIDFAKAREFWSFQPPTRHVPSATKRNDWIRRPLDGFVLARLENEGLTPAAEADRRTLIRRLSFDLTGLPPTPEEVIAFVDDEASDAYERLVDRLLASPHYGERWARVWMDVARYAEDQAHIVGNNKSLFYPNAYLYRDWLIAALNQDMPYDRFLRLQLASDTFEPESQEHVAALGFLGLGPKYYGRGNPAVRAEEWEDRVDVVSRGLLGLTVACARCHDHKYDPIATEDYYALAGVFASTAMYNRPLDDNHKKKKDGNAENPEESIHVVRDRTPVDLNVFIRGDIKNKGPVVERSFLQVLSPSPRPLTNGSGRAQLADAIVERDNPLTARVIVNRVWARHFGQPLVGTPSNFGMLGSRPTHPDLLDDLAVRFMDHGWSLKWLHREIALSATYRQSSQGAPETLKADPGNKLLGHMNRRRLDVEQWRDSLLSVTGLLNEDLGGTSIEPDDLATPRRTVYSRISRFQLHPLLAKFDFPDPNAHSALRPHTTTPLQKLFAINSPFMVELGDALLARLDAEVGSSDSARIERCYQLLLGRSPSSAERTLAEAFLGPDVSARPQRWRNLAQALLATNEMIILD